MSNINNSGRIAKNSVYLTIRMVINILIALYTTRIVFKVLGVVDVGIYNVIGGFVTLFTFLNTSLSNGIQRFLNFELGKNGLDGATKVFNNAILIQSILAIVLFIVTEIVGYWYLYNKMVIPIERMYAAEWIFHFAALSMSIVIIQVPFTAAIIAYEKMNFYAGISIMDSLLKLLMVLALPLFSGDKLILYGLFFFCVSLVNLSIYATYSFNKLAAVKLGKTDCKKLKSMLTFSGWNIFGSFSMLMREQGINLILNLFFGPVVNAARGVANQINGALEGFAANITMPVRPQVIQSFAQGNLERSLRLTYCISKLSSYFMILVSIPISLEIDYILKLWLGENVPYHSGNFVIIVLSITVINILMGSMATIVHASGKMKKYQLYGSIIKLLSIPGAYILLSFGYSPEYALLSVLFFNFSGFIFGLFIIQQLVNFSVLNYMKNVLLPISFVLVGILLLIVPITLIMEDSIYRLLVITICDTIVGFYLIYSKGLQLHEKNVIKQLATSFLGKFYKIK